MQLMENSSWKLGPCMVQSYGENRCGSTIFMPTNINVQVWPLLNDLIQTEFTHISLSPSMRNSLISLLSPSQPLSLIDMYNPSSIPLLLRYLAQLGLNLKDFYLQPRLPALPVIFLMTPILERIGKGMILRESNLTAWIKSERHEPMVALSKSIPRLF